MQTKSTLLAALFCFCQTALLAQSFIVINGTGYPSGQTVYVGCVSSINMSIVTYSTTLGGYVTPNIETLAGSYSIPAGWSPVFLPAGAANKTSVNLSSSSSLPGGGFFFQYNFNNEPTGTASITIQTRPRVVFTSVTALPNPNSSATYTVDSGTSGNTNWTGYGGVRINSTATVSYVAYLSLDTKGTATGANWEVTHGNGSISPQGTSCNAYPTDFMRVVGTATNQYGAGQNATFYLFKSGSSPYRMAYPNPARDQVTLDFENGLMAEELLTSLSLLDEKGKSWRSFDVKEAKVKNYFKEHKGVTLEVKGMPKGIYYLHIKLVDSLYKERISIE
ncbi:MAG: hypothetical protein EOO39_22120 [Cytophagaceae bacterium]|nr:MAG: hypothetical protein EOO39_22120 [Cytophagaceae bacterium]